MNGCLLVASTFGTTGLCDWCGGELPIVKRTGKVNPMRRWCSTDCSSAYWSNHQWALTRAAALKRDDYRCVKCGSDGGTKRGTCWLCESLGRPAAWPCSSAGQREKVDRWRDVTGRVTYEHSERVVVGALEVNHREPRKGAGYTNGCAHHLEGVETLCRPCHVAETKRQLREWKYGPAREEQQLEQRDRMAELGLEQLELTL